MRKTAALLIILAATAAQARTAMMECTGYCQCRICCGPTAHGITASGKPVTANGGHFLAAPRGVPFGTMIAVPGYASDRPVPVLDRGGAITAGHLDCYFNSHRQAKRFGRHLVRVDIQKGQKHDYRR